MFDLCVKLGAKPEDLVPFEKYAAAAQSLVRPASAARALQNGAPNIERADKLVQLIARQKGLSHPAIDAQVALVDRAAGGEPQEGRGGVTSRRRSDGKEVVLRMARRSLAIALDRRLRSRRIIRPGQCASSSASAPGRWRTSRRA